MLGVCAVLCVSSVDSRAQTPNVKPGLWQVTLPETNTVMQVCYTAAVLSGGLFDSQVPLGLKCRNEVKEQSARSIVTRTVCTGDVALEGETRVETPNSETMTMRATSVMNMGGSKQTVTTAASYKWLRADCGAVKPFDPKDPLK